MSEWAPLGLAPCWCLKPCQRHVVCMQVLLQDEQQWTGMVEGVKVGMIEILAREGLGVMTGDMLHACRFSRRWNSNGQA